MVHTEAFLEAVKHGAVDKVSELLEAEPALVNARDDKGTSAAISAVYQGHRGIADLLISKGAELTIFEAATIGDVKKVKAFLKGDPSLALSFAPDGFSALGLASFFGNTEVAEILLEARADPDAASKNPMRVTPLHSAVANRDSAKALALTKMLVAHGAKMNIAQEGGWTPMHQAAAHGQMDVLRILLEEGADIDAKSNDGKLPVDMAIQGGHQEAAALLQHASR